MSAALLAFSPGVLSAGSTGGASGQRASEPPEVATAPKAARWTAWSAGSSPARFTSVRRCCLCGASGVDLRRVESYDAWVCDGFVSCERRLGETTRCRHCGGTGRLVVEPFETGDDMPCLACVRKEKAA